MSGPALVNLQVTLFVGKVVSSVNLLFAFSQILLEIKLKLHEEHIPLSPHSFQPPGTPLSLDIPSPAAGALRSRPQIPPRGRSFLATNPRDDQLALIQLINCRSTLDSDVDGHRYLDIIETVIRGCGLDPNFIRDGKYPIHLAVERGDIALLRVLVHNGARISVLDNVPSKDERETPLRIATRKDSKELAQILLEEGPDPPLNADPATPATPTTAIVRANAHSGGGQPALWFASGHGALPQVFQLLISLGPEVINHICADPRLPTALWAAAAMNQIAVATTLLNAGADPRIPAEGNSTLLHKVNWPVFDALYPLLLDHGAAPNTPDAQGRQPLHLAARAGHLAACEALLGRDGVDVDARDGEGATPLMYAARAGCLRVVRALVARHGADAALRDGEGDDAFAGACALGRVGVATFLLGRQVRGEDGVLRDRDVDVENVKGRSALGLAARGGHVGMVRRLIELGADCGTVPVEDAGAELDLSKPELAALADEIRGLLQVESGTSSGVGVERRKGSGR